MLVLRHCAEQHIKRSCPYDHTKNHNLKTAFLSVVSRIECLNNQALGEDGLRSRALNLYDTYYSSSRIIYSKSGWEFTDPPVQKDSPAAIQYWREAAIMARVMMERLVDSGNIDAYENIKQFYDKAAASFCLDKQLSITPKANRLIM